MEPREHAILAGQSRLRTLIQTLGLTSRKIDKTHAEAADMRCKVSEKPSLLGKLTRWMEQIAGLERKELDIISEINAVEERHRLLRQEKKLRRATEPRPVAHTPDDPDMEDKSGFWGWMAMLLLLSPKKKSRKEEEPTLRQG